MNHRWANRLNHIGTGRGLAPGPRHRISQGPLAEVQGEVILSRTPARVLLAVDCQQGFYIEIDESHVELIAQQRDE
jgi:hypothetical protein